MKRKIFGAVLFIALIFCLTSCGEKKEVKWATVTEVKGSVQVFRDGGKQGMDAFSGMRVYKGDIVESQNGGSCIIDVDGNKKLTLYEGSSLQLSKLTGKDTDSKTCYTVLKGAVSNDVNAKIEENDAYLIQTSNTVMGVRSTQYYILQANGKTYLYVYTGKVAIEKITSNENHNTMSILEWNEAIITGDHQGAIASTVIDGQWGVSDVVVELITDDLKTLIDTMDKSQLEWLKGIETDEEILKLIEDKLASIPPNEEIDEAFTIVYEPDRGLAAYEGNVNDPVAEQTQANIITLTAVDGYEYAMVLAGSPVPTVFSDARTFTVEPNTAYDFYQRVKETGTTKASAPSKQLTLRSLRLDYTGTVINPVLQSKSASNITLVPVNGYEYAMVKNGASITMAFQSGSSFSVEPNTAYDLYQRVRQTEKVNASAVSNILTITSDVRISTPSEPTPAPVTVTTPSVLSVTADRIELVRITGYEYAIQEEGGNISAFSSNTVFTVNPNKKYILYQRPVQSEVSAQISVTTPRREFSGTVASVTMQSISDTQIVIVPLSGYEYTLVPTGSQPSGFSTSNSFTTAPNQKYDAYQRVAETDTITASPISAPLTMQTPRSIFSGAVITPVLESVTPTSMKIKEVSGYEYAMAAHGGAVPSVFSNNTEFTGVVDVSYDIYQRAAMSATTEASAVSAPLTASPERNIYSGPLPIITAAPVVYAESVELPILSGAEYGYRELIGNEIPTSLLKASFNMSLMATDPSTGITWQSSNIIITRPHTVYSFYIRYAQTMTTKESGHIEAATLRTNKLSYTNEVYTPEIVAAETRPSQVTLVARDGYEYAVTAMGSQEKLTWQDSSVFTTTAATAYTFHQRVKETADTLASEKEQLNYTTLPKGTQTAPSAPSVASVTDTSVTVNTSAGYEYAIELQTAGGALTFGTSAAFTVTPGSAYYLYARLAGTADYEPSPASEAASYTAPKLANTEDISLPAATVTNTNISITPTAGYEYALVLKDVEATTFSAAYSYTGLNVLTDYDVYHRISETATTEASAWKKITVTTGLRAYTGETPTAPTGEGAATTSNISITLSTITGGEYGIASQSDMSDITWQDSNVFNSLEANETYYFCQRVKQTSDTEASLTSPSTTIVTKKYVFNGTPAAPEVLSNVSEDTAISGSITLATPSGTNTYEYAMSSSLVLPEDAGLLTWQTGTAFSGLNTNTTYYFYQRVKETETTQASVSSTGISIRTLKMLNNTIPAAPEIGIEYTTIYVGEQTGHEYALVIKDAPLEGFGDTYVFSDLEAVTDYDVYQRIAETADTQASAWSKATVTTGKKECEEITLAPDIVLAGTRPSQVTLVALEGYEYAVIESGESGELLWQDSPVFTTTAATAYIFYQRIKETADTLASDSEEIIYTTLPKGTQTAPSAPSVASNTTISVTLNQTAGYEYAIRTENSLDPLSFGTVYTFTITPGSKYDLYVRLAGTADYEPSPASEAASYTAPKLANTEDIALPNATVTNNKILIAPTDGYEYGIARKDASVPSFDAVNGFIDLDPVTEYDIYHRMAETATTEASAWKKRTVTTGLLLYTGATPSAPGGSGTATTDNSIITLTAITGGEYGIATSSAMTDLSWQASNVFSGLSPNTAYYFCQRIKETSTTEASPVSPTAMMTSNKYSFDGFPVNAEISSNISGAAASSASVTMAVTAGESVYEYAVSTGSVMPEDIGTLTWQNSNVFSGLSTNTTYYFRQRVKETSTTLASGLSAELSVLTPKMVNNTNPVSPELGFENNYIYISEVTGYEYAVTEKDAGSPVFGDETDFLGLEGATEYDVYQRIAETVDRQASSWSKVTVMTGLKMFTGMVEDPEIVPGSTRPSQIVLLSRTGYEYAIAASGYSGELEWQNSAVFTTTAATSYTLYQRVKETSDTEASYETTLIYTTLPKGVQAAPSAPVLESFTVTTITLTQAAGYEYAIREMLSQTPLSFVTEHTFTITPGSRYQIYARLTETADYEPSPSSEAIEFIALNEFVGTVSDVFISRNEDGNVLLAHPQDGHIYEFACTVGAAIPDEDDWVISTLFENLILGNSYTFWQRVAKTDDCYPSESKSLNLIVQSLGTFSSPIEMFMLNSSTENKPDVVISKPSIWRSTKIFVKAVRKKYDLIFIRI